MAARTEAMVSQELGVQIEEPFSILPLESIFDALQAAARARDSSIPCAKPLPRSRSPRILALAHPYTCERFSSPPLRTRGRAPVLETLNDQPSPTKLPNGLGTSSNDECVRPVPADGAVACVAVVWLAAAR